MQTRASKKLKLVLKKHGLDICVLYLIIFIFSFGFYERTSRSWSRGYAGFQSEQTYYIEANQLSFSVPISWLNLTEIVTEGSPPPISSLRNSQKYLHPISIEYFKLLLLLIVIFMLAFLIHLLMCVLKRYFPAIKSQNARIGFLLIALIGLVLGFLFDSIKGSRFFSLILVLGLLPLLIIIVSWKSKCYMSSAIAALAVILSFWWGLRFRDLFLTEHFIRDIDGDDLQMLFIGITSYLILILPIVFFHRLLSKRNSDTCSRSAN